MNLTVKLLEKAAQEERLAHLILLHGGSAAQRREIGLRIAQILNCLTPEVKPCQTCPSCRKIRSGNHPDVAKLEPLKATLGIEQVLAWQNKVYRRHYEGNYKVFMIEQADDLTMAAANSLLKVVEEPPERTIIIMSAENAERLLPTLRSRAQIIYLPDTVEQDWLKGLGEADEQEAREAYLLSGGTTDLASAILQHGVVKTNEWVSKFWQTVANKNFLQLFPLFPVEKEAALLYLQVMAVQMREGLKGIGRRAEETGVTAGNAPAILAIGQAIDALRQQANARLVLEVLAVELFRQGGVIK